MVVVWMVVTMVVVKERRQIYLFSYESTIWQRVFVGEKEQVQNDVYIMVSITK